MLVTRPEPGLGETMAAVAALGFTPLACPLLRISLLSPPLPDAGALRAILLTSGQAVPALAARDPALRAVRLYAVGARTASRARAAGFTDTRSADGDAANLASLVGRELAPPAILLLATASGQGQGLARDLRARGYRLHHRAVYHAAPALALPEAAREALSQGNVAACLFFSAETARNFGLLFPVAHHPVLHAVRALAISPAVAEVLAALPWGSVETAPHPDAEALLALLRRDHPVRREP